MDVADPGDEGVLSRRVLIAISTFGGGTGSHLVRLLETLDRTRWEPAVHCDGQLEMTLPDDIQVFDRTRKTIVDRYPLAQLRQYRALRRTVRSVQPQILHTYFLWPILYGRLLKRAGWIQCLVENREDEGFNWSEWDYRLLRLTATLPDRIICVSEGVRGVVLEREGIDPEKVKVIPNGVPLAPEESDPVTEREMLAELGLEPDNEVVGLVANLNRTVKGVRYFIEAAPAIVAARPRVRLLVVGEGRDRGRLEALAERLGVADRVRFTGFRSDVHRLYPLMDVSALTSLSEGLSITILESMSHGIPVVATRVGGNPELVADGETGILVPPRDPEAFAEAVIGLLANPQERRRMGVAGRERAEREFSQDQIARRYEALYDEVLGPQETSSEARR